MRKLTQEEVEEYFNKYGYNVLGEYTGSHDNILIEKDGYLSEVQFANFQKYRNTWFFSSKNIYWKDNISLLIQRKNPKISFVDCYSKKKSGKNRIVVTMKCECGNDFTKTLDHIQNDKYLLCGACVRNAETQSRSEYERPRWLKAINDMGYDLVDSDVKLTASTEIEVVDKITGYRGRITPHSAKCKNKFIPFSFYHNRENFIYNINVANKENGFTAQPIQFFSPNIGQFRCACGEIFNRRIDRYLDGGDKCPKCNLSNSKFERMVTDFLIENNIEFYTEFVIASCKSIKPLPFDFCIKESGYLIEIDGEQHYHPVCFGGITNEQANINFIKQQQRDEIKNNYCRKFSIPLLRLSYLDMKDDNIWKNKLLQFIRTAQE